MTPKRDRYFVSERTCTHVYVDDYGHTRKTKYWITDGIGYVVYINSYGNQVQPYDQRGRTWIASSGAEIRDYCKAARRRERAVYL